MASIKVKNSAGEWVNASPINQVIEVPAPEKTWKEIELTGVLVKYSPGDYWIFDCSAAGIDLRKDENWHLVLWTNQFGRPSGFNGVATKYQPVVISPMLTRLKGEIPTDPDEEERIGIYRPNMDGNTGYIEYGSDAYYRWKYLFVYRDGVQYGEGVGEGYRLYNATDMAIPGTFDQKAKLIYLS